MYYIVEIKGKQYRVSDGDLLSVDYTGLEKGDRLNEINVLLKKDDQGHTEIGQPYLKNVTAEATVEDETKAPKVVAVHYKPKSGYIKKRGHRQKFSTIKIKIG